jgi:hypothetical protein
VAAKSPVYRVNPKAKFGNIGNFDAIDWPRPAVAEWNSLERRPSSGVREVDVSEYGLKDRPC